MENDFEIRIQFIQVEDWPDELKEVSEQSEDQPSEISGVRNVILGPMRNKQQTLIFTRETPDQEVLGAVSYVLGCHRSWAA